MPLSVIDVISKVASEVYFEDVCCIMDEAVVNNKDRRFHTKFCLV